VSQFFELHIGHDYLSVARFWISNKKHAALNAICAAILWSLWKCRNALIFDGQTWISIKQVWLMTLRTIKKWRLLFKEEMLPLIDCFSSWVLLILKAPGREISLVAGFARRSSSCGFFFAGYSAVVWGHPCAFDTFCFLAWGLEFQAF
jgi:hypothetical protein